MAKFSAGAEVFGRWCILLLRTNAWHSFRPPEMAFEMGFCGGTDRAAGKRSPTISGFILPDVLRSGPAETVSPHAELR